MARISVLIPAYNVERYVAESLASIQNQTIQDLEIIVVNDGSVDSTLTVVEQIAQCDPRIRVISADRNLGTAGARNLGLKLCGAPFIACIDADDIAMPDRLEKQLAFLEANPDVALVGSAMVGVSENGEPIGISRVPLSKEEISNTLLMAPPCSHIWLARREVYGKLAGYRAMAVAEDYDFLLRATLQSL
jgi:glycosyltransferase involved in cell wall biosynthesis